MKPAQIKNIFAVFAILAIVMLTTNTGNAATRTASVSGSWNSKTTWGGSNVPRLEKDAVIINSGITVTVPSGYDAGCTTINFTTGTTGTTASITLTDATSTLTASSTVTIQQPGNGNVNQIDVGAGTFSAASVAMSGISGGTRLSQLLISTGTVTITGNITSAGVDSRIVFSGAGTLNAGGTFMSGTAGTFTASTGTVNFNRAGTQSISPFDYTFNNVTLSGTSLKTTTHATVNGILSMEDTATASAAPTYGTAASLHYNTATSRTAGPEWITPFVATGGVTIENTGTITLNSAEVFNASVPLTINSGAKLATGSLQLTLGGNFVNNGGTFIAGSSPIVIANTMVTQSIAGFTTTGLVSMTKTAGTATFTGNVSGSALTINGAGGTLDLGTGLTHTFTGAWTRTTGTLNGGSSTLKIGGSVTSTGGTFVCETGTVQLNGSALQAVTMGGSDFNRLTVTNASVAGVSFADSFTTAYFTNTTANSLMTFAAGRVYTITADGGMNFQGTSGHLVKLRSGTSGSVWLIQPSGGSWTANYLDVKDSVNIVEQTIYPTNSTDTGNNINWFSTGQDLNSDNIPDWWEYLYHGSLTGLNAGTDSDGDGVINFFEFMLETDPRDSSSPKLIYVDDNGGYDGDGTIDNPYKYIDEALNNAKNNEGIILAEGTYTLSNYSLDKKVMIKGQSARKTIITGPIALGTSSNIGQMIDLTGTNKFILSNVTIKNYNDDKPLISYSIGSSAETTLNNIIITGNDTHTKAMIAPAGSSHSSNLYIFNVLAYGNTASAVVNVAGKNAQIFNNTIVNNTAAGVLLNTTNSVAVKNNIIRANTSQITNNASGTVTVNYCNIQGGYTGTGNYNSSETYIDAAKGLYRILPGTPAENAGTTTAVLWDLEWVTRPQGIAPDVGAYEIPANDNDNDGRTNAQETADGTNLNNPDSDSDGLYEGEEVTYGTNPMNNDTDGDLVKDGDEPLIGMNPAVFDGQILVGIYYESFESPLQYPVTPESVGGTGPWSGTLWGGNTKYSGNIQVQYVGPAAYNGAKIINFKGQIFPRSCNISFIERNELPQWWISIAFIFPRKRLPTDYNEACCIGGAFFRVNENGNFCVYDSSIGNWRVSETIIEDGSWADIFIERNHAAKTCDLWVGTTQVFSNIPVTGPDPNDFIRISLSSASEYDVKVDMMIGYNFSPFPP